jgi:hypothetical protein
MLDLSFLCEYVQLTWLSLTLFVTFFGGIYGNISEELVGRIAVSISSRSSFTAVDPFKQKS